MDRRYGDYCLADPLFYDAPSRIVDDAFAVTARPLPAGWSREDRADWAVYRPKSLRLPPQGWKVHVSASVDGAEQTLAVVWDYCTGRGLGFKLVRSPRLFLVRNGKYADRASSGKLATIYPADERALETVLVELGQLLHGQPGPYVLSDLRWREGPLYVRYGAFADRRVVTEDGRETAAIEDADGRLVPDLREPTFIVPPWVTLPEVLRPHLEARRQATLDELPYRFERALHFSNGGGLYLGVDRENGARVALKEARPHAGLAADGSDAVTRLERERRILERLAGLDCIPALHGTFAADGHRFLALAFVDAPTLSSLVVRRHPLTRSGAEEADLAAYATWAVGICDAVEHAVADVHRRGVVLGDVHPANVLVCSDGRVVLIDFEVAALVGEGRRPALGAMGFAAPRERSGFDVDRHALACLRLFLFLPATSLIALDRGMASRLAAEIAESFPVPAAFLSEAVATIEGGALPPVADRKPVPRFAPESCPELRELVARAILASATLERDDRLFPGDPQQFAPGGDVNVAHGAAGVLLALETVGVARDPAHERWLIDRALRAPAETPLGLYDGLCGVAYVLSRLGHAASANELIEVCLRRLAGRAPAALLDLWGGLSGIALVLVSLTSEGSLRRDAWTLVDEIVDRFGKRLGASGEATARRSRAGLMHGCTGPALLFVRLYEKTRDEDFLDLAAVALDRDLERCVLSADGSLHVDEGWRILPYLADGSAGIGCVLDDFLRHRREARFVTAAAAVRRAAEAPLLIEPGLFSGRAGMILYLARRRAQDASADAIVAAHLRRLSGCAIPHGDGLAFPGRQLLRLSMDLATGSAGVLLATAGAQDSRSALPFLGPLGSRAPSG